MINAFILCDLLWKVQKSHAANRDGSFNFVNILAKDANFDTLWRTIKEKKINCFFLLDVHFACISQFAC